MNLNKVIVLLLVFISTSFSWKVSREAEKVWSGLSCLSSDDFMKEQPGRRIKTKTGRRTYQILEGFIYSGISFKYEIEGKNVKYEVYAFMNPHKSWLREKDNLGTLDHEQGHFNITEIYARKFRKKLVNLHRPADAQKYYRQLIEELEQKQLDFDKDHLGESGVEPKWRLWINNTLEDLNQYTDHHLIPR